MKSVVRVTFVVFGLWVLVGVGGCAHGAKWEALPVGVQAVFIGPGERLWHVKGEGRDIVGEQANLEEIKARVEKQWRRRTPELKGCWPALFDQDGSVWFITNDQRTLLRYDGRQWLERAAQKNAKGEGGFVGVCPGHGRRWQIPYNVQAGKVRAFTEREGVSVFDGEQWSYQAFLNPVNDADIYRWVALFADKDQKGILALNNAPELWRFRDAHWQQVKLGATPRCVGSAVAPDGSLWLGCPGLGIVMVPLDGRPTELPANARKEPWLVPPVKIGEWDVNRDAPGLLQDDAGRTYVSLHRIPMELCKESFGTLVLEKDGRTRFFKGIDIAWESTFMSPPPVAMMPMSGGGNRVWYINEEKVGAYWATEFRFNAEKQGDGAASSERVALKGCRFVQAVAKDGTVYASNEDPLVRSKFGPRLLSLMAYRPEGKDMRPVMKGRTLEIAETVAVSDSEGTLWAPVPGKGLCKFDGMDWLTVAEQAAPSGVVIRAAKGAILRGPHWAPARFALIEAGAGKATVMEEEDLVTLVQKNQAAFVKAFSVPMDPEDWWAAQDRSPGWSVAADKDGRVWVVSNGKLAVCENGNPRPVAFRARNPVDANDRAAGPALVLRLGDGRSVYVSEMSPEGFGWLFRGRSNQAYVMKCENGEVVQKSVAGPSEGIWRAADGSLLVAYRRAAAGKEKRWDLWENEEVVLQRVDQDGKTSEQIMPESPAFMDKSGVFWLAARNVNGLRSGVVRLWKDGAEVGRVQLPGLWSLGIVSEKPGSVWVWTYGGLCHLVASDPKKPGDYRLVSTSIVEGVEEDRVGWGLDRCLMWSKEGLVLKTKYAIGRAREGYRLRLLSTAGL